MKRLVCALLVLIALLGELALVNNVHAFTPVSGVLTSDVTWTKANSPYNFTGNVVVAPNVTLTIEAGVLVNFGNSNLNVNGALIARGSSSDKIVFLTNSTYAFYTRQLSFQSSSTGWNEQTGQGCIIENTILKSITIMIYNASPKITGNEFDSGISIGGGSPIITNNNMTLVNSGINIMVGSPVISNNVLKGNGLSMGIYGSGNVAISQNTISKFSTGIKVYTGSCQITENSITDCTNGIEVGGGTTVTIQRNLINNNIQYGISGGSPYIDSNTITNSRVGIHNPTTGTVITNNNILGHSQNSITAAQTDFDASNNWWGTTDLAAVNQTIYDKKIDNTLGKVTFVPILTAPSQLAPAIPEIFFTPTFTPNPISPPTAAPTEQPSPTITVTLMPTRDPDIPKTGANQNLSIFNLNVLVIAVFILLALVWVVVIMAYKVKKSFFKGGSQD